jgi:hypothetical protein
LAAGYGQRRMYGLTISKWIPFPRLFTHRLQPPGILNGWLTPCRHSFAQRGNVLHRYSRERHDDADRSREEQPAHDATSDREEPEHRTGEDRSLPDVLERKRERNRRSRDGSDDGGTGSHEKGLDQRVRSDLLEPRRVHSRAMVASDTRSLALCASALSPPVIALLVRQCLGR